MFVDVCFPKNNEEEFIKIATILSIRGICFVYEDIKQINVIKTREDKIKIYNAVLNKKQGRGSFSFSKFSIDNINKKQGKIFFIDETCYIEKQKITQVLIKEIKERDVFIGISFSYVLSVIERKNKEALAALFFLIKICKKYKVGVFVASFAKNPLELKPNSEICSMIKLLSKNSLFTKESAVALFNLLEKESVFP